MNTYFTEAWFYDKFSSPDCSIYVSDREYMVSYDGSLTEDDRKSGHFPTETLNIGLTVEMPEMRPCVLLADVEDDEDPFTDEDSYIALAALKRVIKEKHGVGIATYWFQCVDRDEPGYRPLKENERKKVKAYIDQCLQSGPLCKSAQDAVSSIDSACRHIVELLDNQEEPDLYLTDHLNCYTKLRRMVLHDGLPTIADDNMFYEIVMNEEAISIQLCHVRASYSLHKTLSLFDPKSGSNDFAIIPYRTTLYSVSFPILTCAEFAERCGVDQVTVRQWIRRGKLRSAFKVGRDWMIPSTTEPPGRGFTPGYYRVTDYVPSDAAEKYPFLSKVSSHDLLKIDKGGYGNFNVLLTKLQTETILATLTNKEREQFEYFLMEASWVRCHLNNMRLRIVPWSANNKTLEQ